MANRINISVSDELSNDLEQYRDQIPEKVSTICQKALSAKITELKNQKKIQDELKNNPMIVDKINILKKDKVKIKNRIIDLGKNDGEGFIKNLSYEELVIIENLIGDSTIDEIFDFKPLNAKRKIEFEILISNFLRNNFSSKDIEKFQGDAENERYLDPLEEYVNPYFDEKGELASIIIAHYIANNLSLSDLTSNITTFVFSQLYMGSFLRIVKDFCEISKDQLSLGNE